VNGRFPVPSVSLLAAVAVAVAASSCRQDEPAGAARVDFAIEKEYKRGPVMFSVKVDRKEVSLAERVRLVLQVRAKEDYAVEMPKFGEKLEQFAIVDYLSPPDRLLEEGTVLTERIYTLEPFLSGTYKIPPMSVSFRKKDEAEPKEHVLESEELTIEVKSLLPEQMAEMDIKEIAPPVELPPPDRTPLYLGIAGGIGVVAMAGGLIAWRKRRRRIGLAPRRPPHEIAFEAIERLVNEQWIEKGEIKEFYLRLSGVLRRYIEARFGLHAPEHTTEEFLDEMSRTDILDARHQDLLKEFLTHCDLVKFAEYPPTTEEIQRSFDLCKQFILDTTKQESVPTAA